MHYISTEASTEISQIAAASLAVLASAGAAAARAHPEWHKGAPIAAADWSRGRVVGYRHNPLHAPPRGYQWRDVGGAYVLAAIAGGAIADFLTHS